MSLETLFLICAVLGGTVMVCQVVLTLIGLAGESLHVDVGHDVGHAVGGDLHGAGGLHSGGDAHDAAHGHGVQDAHATNALFRVLSFRTLIAAIAFFGIGGLAAQAAEASPVTVMVVAAAAGVGAMYGVFRLMGWVYGLDSEGTVHVQSAVGQPGVVYLRVPGERSGTGKIQINLQNRTMEYEAVTSGPELPTGVKVVVAGVVSSGVLDVEAAPGEEDSQASSDRVSHD